MLGLRGFDPMATLMSRNESVRLIRKNRTHMARNRELPRINTYRLRQSRDAFTSHTSSSRPMPCGQKVNTTPDGVRRAPTIHCLIMDIALHPWRPPHLAQLGTHYKVTLSGGEHPRSETQQYKGWSPCASGLPLGPSSKSTRQDCISLFAPTQKMARKRLESLTIRLLLCRDKKCGAASRRLPHWLLIFFGRRSALSPAQWAPSCTEH
jgi:hypothetical protein